MRDQERKRRLRERLAREAAELRARESASQQETSEQYEQIASTPTEPMPAADSAPEPVRFTPTAPLRTPSAPLTPTTAEMLSETPVVTPMPIILPQYPTQEPMQQRTPTSPLPVIEQPATPIPVQHQSRPNSQPQSEISPAMQEFLDAEETRKKEREEKRKRLRHKVLQARALRQQASERFQQEYGISAQYAVNLKEMLTEQANAMMEEEMKRQMLKEAQRRQRRELGLPEQTREEMLADLPLWMRAVVVIDGWEALEMMKKNYPLYAIFCDVFGDEGEMIRTIDVAAIESEIYTAEDIVGDDETQFLVNKTRFAIVAAAGNVLENYTMGDETPDKEQLTLLIQQITDNVREVYSDAGGTGYDVFPI